MGHKRARKRGRSKAVAWSLATGIGLAAVLAASLSPAADAQVRQLIGTQAQPGRSAVTATGTGAAGGGSAVGAPTAVAPRRTATASASVSTESLQQFWTPARLAAAAASPVAAGPKGATPGRGSDLARTSSVGSDNTLGHSYDNARPSIGILVYADKNLTTHYCTASVVQSPGKNLIMTAAHCRPGYWVAFVPDYQAGARTQPYGIWSVKSVYTDSHYAATGTGTDYDYAFAKVAPDTRGRLLQNVTGGNVLTRTPTYSNWAGVTGYPETASAPADKAVTCWNWTTKLTGYTQMQFLCTGFYSGTSGSPWLIHLDSRTNTGDVIGLIGGLQYGGPNSWISYSPVFDNKIFYLYNYALSH
ncbi:trypsin-like serine protease [Streptacidiphilus sp. PB12-B1b]|uniref:trypsin-like serine peptidase n=1 Tax=Streptacidiphilus sp. PB12-B1b TaxID=2705012 RepID=UPI0015F958D5|nr:trypsin-like serine protease [Streptacidiphilus sp. PB12-B1b]QMU79797.1 trypsin-like serine protease [Streptacidiphilus sp. PB12-B1b]